MSSTLFLRTLTPKCIPSSPPWACFCLSLLSTSVEFIPLFSARVLGIVSRALAKPLMTSCYFPSIVLRCSLRCLESSISMAPPPATTASDLNVLLTTMIASLRDLWVSSRYWPAPPRRTMVLDFVLSHLVNMLNLSFPSWTSSNYPHDPRTSFNNPFPTVVCKIAPVALATLWRSSFCTLPAQKISLSAKYCVARSPIGSPERIILAPDWTSKSSLA